MALSSESVWRIHAPYDGALLGEVPTTSAAECDRALDEAAALHREKRWLAPSVRVGILRKAAELLETNAERFALDAAREGGKPLIDSRVEVTRAIDGLRCAAETLRTASGQMVPMDLNAASAHRLAFVTHEPIGPTLAISAFNHPLNNIVHQVAPAIAAGCPVLVKPAPATPLTCLRFVALLRDAGLPEAFCRVVIPKDDAAVAALAADARIAHMSFIGSAAVGWTLRAQVASGVRVALEHGGVAPVVVAADVDLDGAVAALTKGAFYHAGQVCVSTQRIFADAAIARPLAERLAHAASQLKVGDPTSPDTEVGPLIRQSALERVESWVDEAQRAGAQVMSGGARVQRTCFAPTVVWNPPEGTHLMREEVFGPIVCVSPVTDLSDAFARANALPFAFQAAVFTQSLDTAMGAYRQLDASAVIVNDHTAFRVDWMPFGGLRHSGLGVGGIPFTFRELRHEKLCVLRSPSL